MRCNDCLNLLSSYIDNELTSEERLEFEAHLNKCASCKEELAIQSNIRQLLLTQNNLSMPSELHDKIMQSIKNTDTNKKRHSFIYNRKYMQALTTMAACFVLVVCFVVFQHSSYNVKFSTAQEESSISADSAKENAIAMKQEIDSADNNVLASENRSLDNDLMIKREKASLDDNAPASENRSLDNNHVAKQENRVGNNINNNGDNNALKSEKNSLDNSQDITTSDISDSDTNFAFDIDDEISSNGISNSVQESKESIYDECWEVLSLDKKVAYDQIQELLEESNLEYNVSEDDYIITISIEPQNKIDLFNELKALNVIEDILRSSTSGNRITIIIK